MFLRPVNMASKTSIWDVEAVDAMLNTVSGDVGLDKHVREWTVHESQDQWLYPG